jgi:predicted PurR-regulated permease PerM
VLKSSLTFRIATWLVILVFGTIILIYAKNFLLPIIIASLLSLLLYPVYHKLLSWKIPNALAVIITLLLVTIILVGVIALVSIQLSSLVSDLSGLSGKINDKFNHLEQFVTSHFQSEGSGLPTWILDIKTKMLSSIGDFVSGTISETTGVMSSVVLIIVYVFCFLLYNAAFKNFAFALLETEIQTTATTLINSIQKLVQNYLVGLITVIFIIGILNLIGLLIIGIDHAIFFAFFAATLTIIPYVGITMGAIITAFYALLTKDSVWPAVEVASVMFLVQFLESNLITPRIVGSKVSVNPFVAILVLLIGGEIWGIPGMILAVPLTAILKVLLHVNPSTHALAYFLGSELTDKRVDANKVLHPENTEEESKK